jgi:hypothetical protein
MISGSDALKSDILDVAAFRNNRVGGPFDSPSARCQRAI